MSYIDCVKDEGWDCGCKVCDLQSRLLKAETIIAVMQRALGWIQDGQFVSVDVLEGPAELTKSEHKILEES